MSDSIKIIQDAIVVPCNEQNKVTRADLLIKDDRIAEIGNRAEVLKSVYPSAEVIDATGKVLLPGFVDAHVHGVSSVLRHFTRRVVSADWKKESTIRNVLDFVHTRASKEHLIPLFRAAYFGALKSGVTTLAEYSFDNLDASFRASLEAMKRSDLRGFIALHNGDQVELARTSSNPSIRFALAFPPEDDLTTYGIQSTLRIARELKWPVVVHYGETKAAQEAIRKNFGKSLADLLTEFRVFEHAAQLVHFSALEEKEIQSLSRAKQWVIITPVSALSKEVDVPPLQLFNQLGVPLALGSDWGEPDPFNNMRMVATLLKVMNLESPSAAELLKMHTCNGAKALGLADVTGSLAPGKKADITFVELSDLRVSAALEMGDPRILLEELVFHASTRDVSDVMINGEFFVRQGEIMTYAEEDLKREVVEAMRSLAVLLPSDFRSAKMENPTGQNAEPSLNMTTDDSRNERNDSFEEGFRVVRRAESVPERATILPMPTNESAKNIELPKTTKRVFGDDDY
jgi:5-methylthioadenosine/S-adenosylhomocysteine deaminase